MDDKFQFEGYKGPFPTAPDPGPGTFFEWGLVMPSGVCDLPSAKVILFPLIWHAADIAFIERETGRKAIGRGAYVELVLK